MTAMGYLGIALLMFLENLFPPIPSELIMPLAGFTVHEGKMAFLPAVIAGVVGTVVGALPWYYIGRVVDEAKIAKFADKYGKWMQISASDIEKANAWFTRHGTRAVLLCRLVPGVRTLISLPAGMNHMPMIPFLLYSTIGTTLWVTFLTAAGYFLGQNYPLVEEYIGPVSKIALLAIVIWFGIWLVRKRNRRYE